MSEHWPLVAIEIVMVFGGVLVFAWWQLRDLDREERKRLEREAQEVREAQEETEAREAYQARERQPAAATADERYDAP